MREIPYDRAAAVAYARRWALDRNPAYYNFEKIGGDCTNFTSQCLFAGAHTFDALDRPLDTYIYEKARFLHIDGVRVW